MKEKEEVIVVGAGVIGLAVSVFLLRSGFKVTLIDKGEVKSSPLADFPRTRVLALNKLSIDVLKELGAWGCILSQRFQAYDQMSVWEHRSGGELSFNSSDILEDKLGIIIEEQVLKNALITLLEKEEALSLIAPSEIKALSQTEEEVVLTLEGQSLQAKALIAADGANSFVRRALGLSERRMSYQQKSIVCTVKHTKSHQNTASQVFTEHGPLAFLPLYDENLSSIVWSVDLNHADELLALPEEAFIKRLNDAFLQKHQVLELKTKRVSFPLIKRHAECYSRGRVALLGDAVCGIHPLAGQGMNLGFRELEHLIKLYKAAPNTFLTQKTFREYALKSRSHNELMLVAMDAIRLFFSKNNKLPKFLLKGGMSALTQFAPIKRQLIKVASGQL